MAPAFSLTGGAMLGVASSLHCIGMCGGIAILLGHGRPGTPILHVGRIAGYSGLGALAGALGSSAVAGIDPGIGHALMRWAAAASLGWVGLVTAGLAPVPALLGHAHAPRRVAARLMLRLPLAGRRLAGGFAWGLMPCGMVYGALLLAAFAGTARDGALVMLGFGLGTLPALIAATLGLRGAMDLVRRRGGQQALGGLILLLALASLADQAPMLDRLCTRFAATLTS